MRQGPALIVGCVAAVLAFAANSAAFAQATPNNQTSPNLVLPQNYTPPAHETCCKGAAPPLSPSALSSLESNLPSLLTRNPAGGGQLISSVRDLLLSDSGALAGILGLLPAANADQKSAIAAGLAQAAQLWPGTDPLFAQYISAQAYLSNDTVFADLYRTDLDQRITAAGGGGGSAGGPGGQSNPLGNSAFGTGSVEGINGNGVNTGAFTMTGGVTGSGLTSTTSTTVSP